MTKAAKGDILGTCRFCGGPIKYHGMGRKPSICGRVACVRARSAEKMRRWRAEARPLDVTESIG